MGEYLLSGRCDLTVLLLAPKSRGLQLSTVATADRLQG